MSSDIVVGPRGGAKERFDTWWESEQLTGLTTLEIAQLAFDAGHAFHHEEIDGKGDNGNTSPAALDR
jgi:hypothetical protein